MILRLIFMRTRGTKFGGAAGMVRRFSSCGTLFLDELATAPMMVQEKLLRVIEYGELERVGGSQPLRKTDKKKRWNMPDVQVVFLSSEWVGIG